MLERLQPRVLHVFTRQCQAVGQEVVVLAFRRFELVYPLLDQQANEAALLGLVPPRSLDRGQLLRDLRLNPVFNAQRGFHGSLRF